MLFERLMLPTLLRMDPEEAHVRAIHLLKRAQASPLVLSMMELFYGARRNPAPVEIAGILFPNRVGLAAGFDKQGEALLALQALGFGFLELGSILPRPQPGNDKPRVFRYPAHEAVINRYGFNSDGMEQVEKNIAAISDRIRIPIGISLGKNKDTPNEKAEQDYLAVFERLKRFASYAAVNISSPNTAGLRNLQAKREIERVVGTIVVASKEAARGLKRRPIPVFVKLSPDLTEAELEDALEGCEHAKVSGYILTNTTINHTIKRQLGIDPETPAGQGGISGGPLFEKALAMVKQVRKKLPRTIIMGVGGITIPDCAKQMFDGGADVIQLYTGLIFHGINLLTKCRKVADTL